MATANPNNTLVIVPTYNERDNLPTLLETIATLERPFDLLVVDDNSPDGTGGIAQKWAESHERTFVLHRPRKAGIGEAYRAGFEWALARHYNRILQMDGDLSHAPEDILRLEEAMEDFDLVIGSRYMPSGRVINWPFHRLALSRAAGVYVRAITGMPLSDPTSGFKCFRRSALEVLALEGVFSEGYGFQIESNHRIWRRGMKTREVPICFTERRHNRSKMSGWIVLEAAWVTWRLLLEHKLRRKPRRFPGH